MNLKLILILALVFITSCRQKSKLTPGEGTINTSAGKIWYRIVGEGDKTPIVMLHGGPGVPSYYLKPLQELAKNRPVIFYDQTGCGKSDKLTDTSLMTVDHYVKELGDVIHHFNLNEFYLYGHSWGTMLASEYYLKHPEGINAIILASPALNIARWLKDADTLIATLPDSIQAAIRLNEQNKTYDAPAYQQALTVYYQNFVARKQPWSADLDSTFSQMGQNVYQYMGGPSEFTVTGELKNYDLTNRIGEIKVPVLFICGEYDEARPSTVMYYKSLVPGAQFAMIHHAAHLTMQDNPEENVEVINAFFNGMEK